MAQSDHRFFNKEVAQHRKHEGQQEALRTMLQRAKPCRLRGRLGKIAAKKLLPEIQTERDPADRAKRVKLQKTAAPGFRMKDCGKNHQRKPNNQKWK